LRTVASVLIIAATIAPIGACGGAGGDSKDSSGAGSSSTPSSGSSSSMRGSQSSSAVNPGDAGSIRTQDAAVVGADASLHGGSDAAAADGDGGVEPYKGVANSACGDLTKLGATWYYNWTLSPGSCTASQFVPMVKGNMGAEQTSAGITQEVSSLVAAGYDTVLGFNEPDNATQSNIPVATAIMLWPSFNNPAVRLGSPATQGNSTGLAWLTTFMDQVNADTTGTLRVDFIAAHWYGWNSGSCDAKAATLEAYLKQVEAIPGNRPIWLTEWGCLQDSNPTEAVVQACFSGALTMLAKHPRVERYGWYPWTTNNELVGDAGLTSLGQVFAMAPATQ
jgi:hypothetical protein